MWQTVTASHLYSVYIQFLSQAEKESYGGFTVYVFYVSKQASRLVEGNASGTGWHPIALARCGESAMDGMYKGGRAHHTTLPNKCRVRDRRCTCAGLMGIIIQIIPKVI